MLVCANDENVLGRVEHDQTAPKLVNLAVQIQNYLLKLEIDEDQVE
jgi:hypothetical protein